MDALTRALVGAAVRVFDLQGPVLEIGSRQVQSAALADLRPLFPDREYVGCDMEAGPGVDRIERIERLGLPDGWARTVLCLNMLEHVWPLAEGMAELYRVTAPGGWALVTTVFEFSIHGYPEDYWRFTPRALERLLAPFGRVLYGWQGHPKRPRSVFAVAQKSPSDGRPDEVLADAWKRQALAQWHDGPGAWDRFRAVVGGALFGSRHFQTVRHWRDLTIEARSHGP